MLQNLRLHTKYIKPAFFAIPVGLMSSACIADTPYRLPYDYQLCSTSNTYCARVSPIGGISIFKVGSSGQQPLAVIPGWRAQVFLSNDGEKIVTVASTIVPEHGLDHPVVNVYLGGRMLRTYLVRDIIGTQEMGPTSSGFHWGDPIGFSADELFFSFKLDGGEVVKIPISR